MMLIEDNKAVVRRYFEAIDSKRDPSVVEEFLTGNFVSHNPSPGFAPDRNGQKETFAHFLAATPDAYHVIEEMVAEGDKVVSRITAYGTQTGELFGIPATGRKMEMTGIAIHRIENGKIAEHWANIDMLGGLQQLGVVPTPGQSERP